MLMSLRQAGHTTGLSRTAILKAIKRGALSGSKDHEGWHVDGAELELARVFQTNTRAAPCHDPHAASHRPSWPRG